MMMPGAMPMMPGMAMAAGQADKMKEVAAHRPKREDDKVTTVFVGGLRKSTSEDKVIGHFAKYGQVESVDIKRLPDGSSRGFAFVKFADKDSVQRCVEAKASHMIDNKWVAVRPHGGTAFQAAQHAERQRMAHDREKEKETEGPANEDDYEEKWSEKYLQQAASLQGGSEEKDDDDGKEKETPMNPMMAMMMNPMMMGMMMNPMMAGMNPMMMGARPMMMPGCCGGCPGAMPPNSSGEGEGGNPAAASQGSGAAGAGAAGAPGAGAPCMPCGGCMMPGMPGCMMPGCCGCGPCGGCCMGMPGMPMMPGMGGAAPGAAPGSPAPGAAPAANSGASGESGDAEAEGGSGPVKEGGGENRFQPY